MMQKPQIKPKNKSTWLWILPLIALGIGVWLAYERLSVSGPEIEITFKSAQGLQAGNTKLRYKDLDVGYVSQVELSEDLSYVLVKAQMLKTAIPLLKTDSQFWVVKPQITTSGISGLSTIISGTYIAIEPGTSDEESFEFSGLEDTPLITPSEPGLRIHLVTDDAIGVNVGTPLYYKGIKVGQVEQIKFDDNFTFLDLLVFVRAPYDELITSNTKFFNIGGFKFDAGNSGLSLELDSIETLLLGGITFNTPTTFITSKEKVDENTVFNLYASEKASKSFNSFKNEYYVIYFNDNIRGLSTGSAVVLNGIKIGEVIDVRLLYDADKHKTAVPILVEIKPDLIDVLNNEQIDSTDDLIPSMVKNGLHASIETANYITGQKMVSLSMFDEIDELSKDPYSSYQVLPAKNIGFTKMAKDVEDIINTIKSLPIKELFSNANDATDRAADSMAAFKRIVDSPELQNLGPSFQASLEGFDGTVGSVKNLSDSSVIVVNNLNGQLKDVAEQLEHTLYGLSPESSLYYSLQETLQTLEKTAKSVDGVARMLNEKPNALIFGED